jgi:eukaryotic-like serine/threonine-protein kinase
MHARATYRIAPADGAGSEASPVDVADTTLDEQGFRARYTSRAVLGQGAMGEVRLCKDQRIGREVALKVILPKQASRADVSR